MSSIFSDLFYNYEDYFGKILYRAPVYRPTRNVPYFADNKAQGRNERCACGSGLKFKKCCGKPISAEDKISQKLTYTKE